MHGMHGGDQRETLYTSEQRACLEEYREPLQDTKTPGL
jgi:hypothetical protein